jgi:hypothetical protein
MIALSKIVRFGIGDVIHHEATNERGRIVRWFEDEKHSGYIVATTNWSGREIEVLWYADEFKESTACHGQKHPTSKSRGSGR